jgi:threonyl-tRNA synthetase
MQSIHDINKDMKLWFLSEQAKGLPFWQPAGATLRMVIEDFWRREHAKHGYQLVYTPHIASASLWETSGHSERFSDLMFDPIGDDGKDQYRLRPMNCPFHILLFKSDLRSHHDLPIRYAELATVYRKIPSGGITEMLEDRGFTQDDAHIFCDSSRAREELREIVKFIIVVLTESFAINDYKVILRLRPAEAMGDDASWDAAHQTLRGVLADLNLDYDTAPGEGVFYGPKIDFEIPDGTERPWICSTVQLDLVLAGKFGVSYRGASGRDDVPLIIHRTVLGSLERFIAVLVARTQGHLPLWLAPIQVYWIAVKEGLEENVVHIQTTRTILDHLTGSELRVIVDRRPLDLRETKARAIKSRVPYIIVSGAQERASGKLSVTPWRDGAYTDHESITVEEFAVEIKTRLASRN